MIPYFYRPIPYYNGKVLKCAGMATEENRKWFFEQNPGSIELDHYAGDRIKADNHEELV